MEIETAIGSGGLGSLIGAIATAIGIKQRQNKTDEEITELKQNVVFTATCIAHRTGNDRQDNIDRDSFKTQFAAVNSRLDRNEEKLDAILKGVLEAK